MQIGVCYRDRLVYLHTDRVRETEQPIPPDLASHCRLLLHDRPKHTRLIRYGVLYPLYVLSEIAIISTDLAELLGSAIGLVIIIPNLPLWGAVVLTAADVLIFLAISNPSTAQGRPAKVFEYTIILLVEFIISTDWQPGVLSLTQGTCRAGLLHRLDGEVAP